MNISAEYFRTLQNRMDLVGNNLANILTTGFKEQLLSLEESYDAQDRSNTQAYFGGVPESPNPVLNAWQYSGKRLDFTQGALVSSDNPYDMAILGEGFFQVRTPDGGVAYTRAGTFTLDAARNLVNSRGLLLEPAIFIPANVKNVSINTNGDIIGQIVPEIDENGEEIPPEHDFEYLDEIEEYLPEDQEGVIGGEEINESDRFVRFGRISLYRFANPDGLRQAGDNLFFATEASGEAVQGVSGENGYGVIKASMLESSNVDLTKAMTNLILIQRAYQVEARIHQNQDEMIVQAIEMRG